MRLTALTVSGFKSFPKRTNLVFGAGLTAIIGPNGSGKSNLAEAIRWVLGEQSAKQLRGKKVADVIFAGSPSRKRSHAARVELTFENESGRFPVEAAEVTLGRTLTHDGESEYTLNGDVVRLVDVQQALAEAGIGAKSYTVISQGMVDRYLTATPEGRRELFDEATGIRSLQIKIARASRQLQQTQQHHAELQMILEELKPRLRVLRRQVERQQQREQIEAQFKDKQALWYQATWHQHIQRLEQLQRKMKTLTDRIAEARKARRVVEAQLLSAAKHPAPTPLLEKLRHAEQTYQLASTEYERIAKERAELTASLQEIQQARQHAEHLLRSAKQESFAFDWIGQARLVLRRCRSLLYDLRAHKSPRSDIITRLEGDIDKALEHLGDDVPFQAAQSLLARLEKPLQEVARLKAVEQERIRQLERLPALSAPSADEARSLQEQIRQMRTSYQEDEVSLAQLEQRLEQSRAQELDTERAGSATQAELVAMQEDIEQLKQEILRERGSSFFENLAAPKLPVGEAPSRQELSSLQAKLAALGEIDPLALKEYEETRQRAEHLGGQLHDVEAAEANILQLTTSLQQQMQTQFRTQFQVIEEAFSHYFTRLFEGGQATIAATEEGIDITVRPPGKKSHHVHLLSGGEKALTSLALLLAILEAQRPSFVVLDEVDAALDEANSYRFASVLKEKSQSTQCIVITHNRSTMGYADTLYGVTMDQHGVSNVYSVRLQDVAQHKRSVKEIAV